MYHSSAPVPPIPRDLSAELPGCSYILPVHSFFSNVRLVSLQTSFDITITPTWQRILKGRVEIRGMNVMESISLLSFQSNPCNCPGPELEGELERNPMGVVKR